MTLLLAVTGMLYACKKPSTPVLPPEVLDQTPSQTLKQFKLQDIRNGHVATILEAPEGRLIEQQGYADLDLPIVTFFDDKGVQTSKLHSDKGHVIMKTKAIVATGHVVVVTADSTTLTTESLRYDPDKKLLLSDEKVRIVREGATTQGVGFVATPDLNDIQLHRQTAVVNTKQNGKSGI